MVKSMFTHDYVYLYYVKNLYENSSSDSSSFTIPRHLMGASDLKTINLFPSSIPYLYLYVDIDICRRENLRPKTRIL